MKGVRVSRHAMGTEFQVLLAGEDADYLRDAGEQALDEVERLEDQISHYRPGSDLCDFNQRGYPGPVRVVPEFRDLLRRAVDLSELTGGAFDPCAGALIRCWGFYRGSGAMPTADAIEAARARCGTQWLQFHDSPSALSWRREGVELHLGAMGKGTAVDLAVAVLRRLRVQSALVHGGTSTVFALGCPPGDSAWHVGLCDPRDRSRRLGTVALVDRALSTSGDYEQFFEHEGTRYSHLLDPRSGWPVRGVHSATVTAESAEITDALSTAVFVGGEVQAALLCEKLPALGVVLVTGLEGDGAPNHRFDVSCYGSPAFHAEG